MNRWFRISHEWLCPRRCVLCASDARTLDLCPRCITVLPRIMRGCEACGISLSSGRLCAGCLNRPRRLGQVCIPYRYEPPLSSLILRLKFHRRLEAATPLGGILLERVRTLAMPRPDVILPVPLHPARLRQRGFNQALEIARPLAEGLGVPLAPGLASRRRNTAAQSSLANAPARRRNVRDAFEVDFKRAAPPEHVAIVDDVVTTGATVTELARALKRAGVYRVDLWSVARAAPP